MSWDPCKCLHPLAKRHEGVNADWCVRCGGKIEPIAVDLGEDLFPRPVQANTSTSGRWVLSHMLANVAALESLSFPVSVEKPKRKCRLDECDELTSHNGGYCCAVHCLEDRKRERAKVAR